MKFLLIVAAVVAVAVASPPRFILPDITGPTPIIDIDPSEVIAPGPAIVDESVSPIDVGPAIIDESIVAEGANYQAPSPLVQVIINVNSKIAENPTAENPIAKPSPLPVLIPEDIYIEGPNDKPEEVIVAPVIVPEKPVVQPEPIIVAPIEPAPVINLPDILN